MQRFRTSTPMGDVRTFKFTVVPDETWEEGKLYKVGDTVGMLLLDIQYDSAGCKKDKEIVQGEKGVLVYHIDKVMLNKAAEQGDSFGVGDKIYWSGTNGAPVVNTWQSGYYWIGIATEPASASAATVEVDLKGDKATIGA